jgi:uroporphyrinogen decarboxylase
MSKLTSQERVNRMIRGEDHDRVPRCDGYWPETLARWRKEGADVDHARALELLGNDFAGLCWADAMCFPEHGERVVKDEGETIQVVDPWGQTVRKWKDPERFGTPEHLGFDCQEPEDWYDKYKPALLANTPQLDPDVAKANYAEAQKKGMWTHLTGLETFECLRRLVGDETMLMAMVEEPEWVVDMSRTFTDAILGDWQNVLDQTGIKPDGVWIYGDMAFNHGPLCSPDMYKELVWPDHRRMAAWAHERGMPVIFHTDGDVRSLIPLYIEAGFNMIQPMEAKANMDVRDLAPKFGDRFGFFGNIDMHRLSANDPEVTEDEVVSKLRAGMSCRRYTYHSDHSVPPGVSWSTYRQIIDLLDRHGLYEQAQSPSRFSNRKR